MIILKLGRTMLQIRLVGCRHLYAQLHTQPSSYLSAWLFDDHPRGPDVILINLKRPVRNVQNSWPYELALALQ